MPDKSAPTSNTGSAAPASARCRHTARAALLARWSHSATSGSAPGAGTWQVMRCHTANRVSVSAAVVEKSGRRASSWLSTCQRSGPPPTSDTGLGNAASLSTAGTGGSTSSGRAEVPRPLKMLCSCFGAAVALAGPPASVVASLSRALRARWGSGPIVDSIGAQSSAAKSAGWSGAASSRQALARSSCETAGKSTLCRIGSP